MPAPTSTWNGTTTTVHVETAESGMESAVERRERRLDDIWGAEPIYQTQPEDRQLVTCCGCGDVNNEDEAGSRRGAPCQLRIPDLFSVCFFSWSGDLVFRAVKEDLELPEMLGPIKDSRAYACGKKLSLALNTQWGERHCWDTFIGTSVTVSRRDGDASHESGRTARVGVLCFVGTVASYNEPVHHGGEPEDNDDSHSEPDLDASARARRQRNRSRERQILRERRQGKRFAAHSLYAGVLWVQDAMHGGASTIERQHHHGIAQDTSKEGPSCPLRRGQDAYAEATATWLNEDSLERLLPTGSSVLRLLAHCTATYEPVERILFLPTAGTTGHHDTTAAVEEEADGAADRDSIEHRGLLTGVQRGGAPFARPVPRSMSLLRALLSSLGGHLWRLGYWRVLVDVTTLAAPMVLKAYIRYLNQDQVTASNATGDDSASADNSNHTLLPTVMGFLHVLGVARGNATDPDRDNKGDPWGLWALDDWTQGVVIVLLFFLVSFVHSVSLQKYAQLCYRCFYTYRSAICAVIMEKSLAIEARSLSLPGLHAGRIVNMLTNDVEQLEQMCILFWPTIVAPFEVGFAMYFLYRLVGWAVFAGFGISVFFVPVQLWLTYKVYRCYADLARASDARLKETNEFLGGVRAAKFMSWEPVFLARIQAKRDVEMKYVKRAQNLFTAISFATDALPSIVTATMFAVYFFSGHSLSPEVIYPTLSLASLMCLPFRLLPMYASWMSSFAVSMGRLTTFLERPDADDNERNGAQFLCDVLQRAAQKPPRGAAEMNARALNAVEFHNATITAYAAEPLPTATPSEEERVEHGVRASQTGHLLPSASSSRLDATIGGGDENQDVHSDPQQPHEQQQQCYLKPVNVLSNITLNIPRDKFTVIIGPTGSGKSSLLMCLLGALEVTQGSVLLRDNDTSSIAYVPEKPWVMDASLEDNIVFFDNFDRARLDATLTATQLMDDLPALPDGIATRVGEKGITLSGGQQARLSLARAVYPPGKELYLLDDPLSALDPRVAQLVVQQCLLDMLKGKTRVLATHQTHVAQYADFVVVMAEGKVEFQGTYAAYKTYARSSTYRGRRSGFVEYSGSMLPVTQPNSTVDLTSMIDSGVGSPVGVRSFLKQPSHSTAPSQATAPEQQDDTEGDQQQTPLPCDTWETPTAPEARAIVPSQPSTAMTAVWDMTQTDGIQSAAAATAPSLMSPTLTAAVIADQDAITPMEPHHADDAERHVTFAPDVTGGTADHQPPRGVKAILSMADEEERARGAVPFSLYQRYITACGGRNAVLAFVFVYIFSELLMVSSGLWLSYWSAHADAPNPGNHTAEGNTSAWLSSSSSAAPDDTRRHGLSERTSVYIYLGCVLAGALGVPLRFLVSLGYLRHGSRVIHENLLVSISRATLTFFDAVPHGRLLNRFSRDIRLIDGQLQTSVVVFAMSAVYLSSSLIIMVGSQLMTIFIVVPFVIVFYRITLFNCAMVRTLQRLDNVATAPVVSALHDILGGRWTIRAFHRTSEILFDALKRIDTKFSSSYTIVVGQVWVAVRVQLLSVTLLSSVAFLGVLSRHVAWVHINLGLISLTITNASGFMTVLSRLMDAAAALEASMNSVERVTHYTDNAPQEGGGFFRDTDTDNERTRRHERLDLRRRRGERTAQQRRLNLHERDHDDEEGRSGPPNSLAAQASPLPARGYNATAAAAATNSAVGSLELQHVFLRYRAGLPLVVQDLSFAIRPGERIGVVGRTGSGKSSLMLILMRLIDITAGSILVNGRDVHSYRRVEQLRRLFAIIPQDPVLFDGTIRGNLDPLNERTDAEVMDALRHVGMESTCRRAAGTSGVVAVGSGRPSTTHTAAAVALAAPVAEGGRNFSVGQRQLLCLARALLRKESCFLLMDKATASVDGAMDQQIQRVVQQQFPRHTILSIAHRLHTVAQYDRILMLDAGGVACFDTPEALMAGACEVGKNGESVAAEPTLSPFAQLVRSMGPDATRMFMERVRNGKTAPE